MLSAIKKLFAKSPQPQTAVPATNVAPQAAPVSRQNSQSAAPAAPPPGAPTDGIAVNLKAVVAMMPDTLKKRLDKNLSGKELIYVSRGDALRQLPAGSVRLPFSDIVRQSPNMFLPADAEMLATMVSLPLQEILPHIKTLPRRSAQRQVEVPQDFAPVFGTGSEQSREVKPTTQPTLRTGSRPAPPPPPDESVVIPPPQPRKLPPPAARPLPKPEPAPMATPVAAPLAPAAPITPLTPLPIAPPKTLEQQSPIKMPSVAPAATPAPTPATPAPAPLKPVAAPLPAATPVAPAPAAPVRVATPAPAAPPVAPKPIPTPTPVARPVTPVARPAAPVAPAAPVPTPAAVPAEPALGIGEVFGQPQKTEWTPQEVVESASTLRGVAGALITTVDGLPVAFHLPPNLSGNAVAAFIPQMYTRITQYTRDLKLGDAKNLTIFVENVPLQIFRTGSVYFTALGKANETLPKPQLTAIAAALGRQS